MGLPLLPGYMVAFPQASRSSRSDLVQSMLYMGYDTTKAGPASSVFASNVVVHCACLFMDPNVLVSGTSIIVRGTIGTIPWYDPFVRSVGRREVFYHNYKK